MSYNTKLNRLITGYLAGSRYLCIIECKFPAKIENILKKELPKKFNLYAGKEYFEGDEDELLKTFTNIVFENKTKNIFNNNNQNIINNVKTKKILNRKSDAKSDANSDPKSIENLDKKRDDKSYVKSYVKSYANSDVNSDVNSDANSDANSDENSSKNLDKKSVIKVDDYMCVNNIKYFKYIKTNTYTCKCCNFKTEYKRNYDNHILTLKHINNFKTNKYCDICEKEYATNKSYKNHYNKIHYNKIHYN